MSLTVGSGPFGHHPVGSFNFSPPPGGILYFEDSPRWIRGTLGGQTIVDSRRVKLLHETGRLPVYFFPEADVRMDLLEPGERRPGSALTGDAQRWTLRAGDRVVDDAAWSHPDPPRGAPPLEEYVAFRWEALDEWLEEGEPAIVHPRDPYHRVDILDTPRHVVVRVNGEVVADTTRAKVLFETGLPPRWYIPIDDVRDGALVPDEETRTGCAYKGFASYWSVRAGGQLKPFLAWTYRTPRREAQPIAGYVCFFNERADIEVDGERQERPTTPWSGTDWARRG